jgi:hypothetical protein
MVTVPTFQSGVCAIVVRTVCCKSTVARGTNGRSMDPKLRRIADYFAAAKDAPAVNPRMIDPDLLPHIFILDIERTSAVRLRVRLAGTRLDAALGRKLEGRYLEEFVHGPRGGDVIAGLHECAQTRVPVWMRQMVRLPEKLPRYVEGVAFYLAPERLYGGLIVGEGNQDAVAAFEKKRL